MWIAGHRWEHQVMVLPSGTGRESLGDLTRGPRTLSTPRDDGWYASRQLIFT